MCSEPLRVLCVDDRRDVADSEALLLGLYGYEAAACYGGGEALAEVLRFQPDVCLVDYAMPDLDGGQVARRLRAWRAGRPLVLIAVTSHGSDEARAATAAAGFHAHLVKPVDLADLLNELNRIRVRPDVGGPSPSDRGR